MKARYSHLVRGLRRLAALSWSSVLAGGESSDDNVPHPTRQQTMSLPAPPGVASTRSGDDLNFSIGYEGRRVSTNYGSKFISVDTLDARSVHVIRSSHHGRTGMATCEARCAIQMYDGFTLALSVNRPADRVTTRGDLARSTAFRRASGPSSRPELLDSSRQDRGGLVWGGTADLDTVTRRSARCGRGYSFQELAIARHSGSQTNTTRIRSGLDDGPNSRST